MFYYNVDESIQLRILEMKYAEPLFSLVDKDRNYLRQWMTWVDHTNSPMDLAGSIQQTLNDFAASNGFYAVIFFNKEIAGCIGLHYIDWIHKKTSIGAWLGYDYQGYGIVTKSIRAILDYIFGDLRLNEVELRVAATNKKSRAIPEKLGFKQVGIVYQAEWLYDHYVDHIVYRLLREDYLKWVK